MTIDKMVGSTNNAEDMEDIEEEEESGHEDECRICGKGGTLLCCDFCPLVFHMSCLTPPMEVVPKGKWRCYVCAAKLKEEKVPKKRGRKKKEDKQATPKQESKPSEEQTKKKESTPKTKRKRKAEEAAPKAKTVKSRKTDAKQKCATDQLEKRPSRKAAEMANVAMLAQSQSKDVIDDFFEVKNDESVNGITRLETDTTMDYSDDSFDEDTAKAGEIFEEEETVDPSCTMKEPGTERRVSEEDIRIPLVWKSGRSELFRYSFLLLQTADYDETVDFIITWIDAPDDVKAILQPKEEKNEQPPEENNEESKNETVQESKTEVDSSNTNTSLYLVKWSGRSYRACLWVPYDIMVTLSKVKLRNYIKQNPPMAEEDDDLIEDFKPAYLEIDRIIADKNTRYRRSAYLVKWKELGYDECTWEMAEDLNPSPKELDQYSAINQIPTKKYPSLVRAPKYTKQPAFLDVGGELHEYQMDGLNWIRHSFARNTNVILADEMGLGKTIQTIAFLSSLNEEISRGPFLVVVPLSTLRNWEREFEKWAPHLNVVKYTGSPPTRELIRKYEFQYSASTHLPKSKRPPKFNVLLTNYSLILQDQKYLNRFSWQALVVDEAHRLKNKKSKLFGVLSNFTTRFKLLLTGTPLQNNIGELFVLLNFLTNKKFQSLDEFENQFTNINKEEQVKRLHQLLAPHMLRRLKSDVLSHMPSKAELIVRVEMSEMQKKYYKAILTKNYNVLRSGKVTGKISLMNVVCELQKCCNHPYLFNGAETDTTSPSDALKLLLAASGKMNLLDMMLTQLHESGHRVLIFSQMTRMLDILEDYLFYKNWSYERIDGSVTGTERQNRIDKFNSETSNQFVFLLSTRAGGLGINLASADTVILYDSDWNPHNDIQAFSRAHRLGQVNKVMIYRLVTRASVEERIVQKAKEKMMLEHLVVEKMNSRGETLLKKGELDDILRFGTENLFGESTEGEIVYDKKAVASLLDRSQEAVEEHIESQDDYLNSFKVAHYDVGADQMVDEEEEEDREEPPPEPNTRKYWTRMLSTRYQDLLDTVREEEEKHFGKGKRVRQNVSYYGSDVFLGHWNSSIKNDKEKRTRKAKEEPADANFITGEGNKMKIYGFASNQRSGFYKLLMMYGMKDGTWSHITQSRSGVTKSKREQQVINYGNMVMEHVLENPDPAVEKYSDGAPYDAAIHTDEFLIRLIATHLIEQKVLEYENTGEFNIKERGWSDLTSDWSTRQDWQKEDDLKLLQGISIHGYGKWAEIIRDESLELLGPAHKACKKRLPSPAPAEEDTQPLETKESQDEDTPMPDQNADSTSAPAPPPEDDNGVIKPEIYRSYKPNKIISRFLSKRASLLENALFIEFQFANSEFLLSDSGFIETPPHVRSDAIFSSEFLSMKAFMQEFGQLYNSVASLNDQVESAAEPVSYSSYKRALDGIGGHISGVTGTLKQLTSLSSY